MSQRDAVEVLRKMCGRSALVGIDGVTPEEMGAALDSAIRALEKVKMLEALGEAAVAVQENNAQTIRAKDDEVATLKARIDAAKATLAHEAREDCCTRQPLNGPVYCELCQAMAALDGES